MTIREAINSIDKLKPNDYTQSEKIAWLSNLDGMVKIEIIDTHETDKEINFTGYTDETDLDTLLLVSEPYSDLYIPWLESKIDYSNAEQIKYNNSITRFNDLYSAFYKYYNRTYMPKGSKVKYI